MTSPKTANALTFAANHPVALGGTALLGTAAVRGGLQAKKNNREVMKHMEAARMDPGTPVAKFALALEQKMHVQFDAYEADAARMKTAAPYGQGVMSSVFGGFAEGVTKTIADKLFAKPVAKVFDIIDKKFYLEPKQKNVLKQVIQSDPILSQAMQSSPEMVMDAYKTIKLYAPSLTVDVNSLRNFLRQAVTMGGQVDFMTVKLLGEIEKNNRQARGEITGGR